MSAGRTPITEEGLPGARDLHIHWAQESFDQAAMLREYVKWDYELRTPVQLEAVVDRALRADAGRAARARLPHAAARGARRQPLASLTITSPARRQSPQRAASRTRRGSTRRRASSPAPSTPLILVSAAGHRSRAPSPALVGAGGSRRHRRRRGRSDLRELPARATTSTSATTSRARRTRRSAEADAILVVEADVPWYPALAEARGRRRR